MIRTATRLALSRFALVTAVMLPACSDVDVGPYFPFEPEFTNNTDDLQLKITVTDETPGVSGSDEVTWQNTGRRANVNQSSQLTGGFGAISIYDGNGTLVYSGSLLTNGSFTTSPDGVAGAWKIRVEASGLRGTVSVRIQRRGP